MAQVRKLQPGGKLTINGNDFTIDQINEYMNSGGFSSQERAALAGIVSSIAGGASRNFDRNANSISGEGVTEDLAQFYGSESKAAKNSGRSTRWANRQARRNSDHHIVNTALEKFGGIEDYYNKKKDAKKSDNKLGRGSGWFDTDDSGAYVSGPSNLSREAHIRRVYDYLSGTNTDFDLSGWDDPDTLNGLTHYYKAGMTADDLINAIKSGNLKSDQIDALKAMGYVQSENNIVDQKISDLKTKFQTAGYDYDTWSPYVEFNDKGQLVARRDENGNSVFSALGGNGNYYFNQQFVDANPKYNFLKDHFLIDGVLYKASDALNENSDLYKYLRKSGGFYDLNKSGDWIGANNLIRQFWDGQNRSNYSLASDAEGYSSFLYDNPTYRWTSITDAYDTPLEKNQQLVEIYDPNDSVNEFGWGSPKYAVLDSEGNLVKFINSPGNLTGRSAQSLKGRKIARTESGDSVYDDKIIIDPTDSMGDNVPFRFYQDPETGDLVYSGDIKFASNTENKDYVIPRHIAKILSKNKDFINKLASTPGMLTQFQRLLGRTVNSGVRDAFSWLTDDMSVNNWRELGFGINEQGQDEAKLLAQYFDELAKNKNRGNRISRRNVRLTDKKEFKLGGKIDYLKKLQPGGTVGNSKMDVFTEKKISNKFQNTENFANIGSDKFTASDWTELGALVADLTGVGLGLSGAPIASGVAGAVGSTAGFVADINRDGLDWGDVGSYVANLGLDTVSILPFLGSGAQGIKVVNGIRKAATTIGKFLSNPTVIKSLAGLGIGSAVKVSADKIINGEEWDVRDIRNVINGLTGVLTLKKTGVLGNSSKKTSGEIEVKVGDKKRTVKLSESDLNEIQTSNSDQKLREIISKKIKGNVKPKDIDFSPAKVKEKLGWKFWKGKQPTDQYDFNVKTEKIEEPLTSRGIADGSQEKARLNEFLRTGQWYEPEFRTKREYFKTQKEVSEAGASNVRSYKHPKTNDIMLYSGDVPTSTVKSGTPKNKTDLLRSEFRKSWNPFSMTPEARAMLRKAQIFTPGLMPNFDRVIPIPVGFIESPEKVDNSVYYRKKGGKIVKAQPGTEIPDYLKGIWGEVGGKVNIDHDMVDVENPGSTVSSLVKDAISARNGDPAKGAAAMGDIPVGPAAISTNYAKDHSVAGKTPTRATKYISSTESGGSPVGINTRSGLGWRVAGDIATSLGKGVSAYIASKAQMDLVNQLKPFQEQHTPEHSFRYRDPGIDLAYNNAINQQQSYARNFKSSDQALNAAVGLQTADKTAQLELERGLKKAQIFDEQQTQHQNLLQQEAQNRTGVVNRNAQRANALDAQKLQQKGAFIAQNQGVAQGVIDDVTKIGQQARAGKKALAAFDAKNAYSDKMNTWRTEFNNSATNGLVDGMDFSTWVNSKYKDEIRNLQRGYIASQYAKKGGRIRPTSEQIRIDNNKIRAKAISQLSKQAFELLKIALS